MTVLEVKADVSCVRVSEMSADMLDQWRDLHLDCVSPNIYMSPDFVLTALDTICKDDPLAVCVTQSARLVGLAILQEKRRSLAFPLRSMRAFDTIHSFMTGILLRKHAPDSTVDTFVRAILDHGGSTVYFRDFDMTSPLAWKMAESAKRQNFHWYELFRYARPILEPGTSLDEWQKQRRKMMRESMRQRRRLWDKGELSWHLLMPEQVTEETVETFLALEHDGWKGERSTSLLSRGAEALFFRQLVARLVKSGEIFFTELRLNDEAIASTVNFFSGNIAFAFKVGWKKKYARFSPGILNEISFVEHACTNELPFKYIESGTNDESYIDRLWPGKISMFNGYLICGSMPTLAASASDLARRIKRALA